MLWTILIILLIFALIGGLPHWGYMQNTSLGYFPSGAVLLILVVIVILMSTGRV